METFNTAIYIIITLSCLFFALFVYFNNKRSLVNIFFSLYTISLIGWIATLFVFYNCDQRLVLLVGRLNFAVIGIAGYFGFYFGYFFPKKIFHLDKKIHIMLFLWQVFFVWITIFTDLIDKNEIIGPDGIETVFGKYYFIFILHFVVLSFLIFIFPLCKYKKVNNLQKQQIKYFALGTSLSLIIGVITNILLPFALNYYKLQIFGPVGLFFFFGFTSYAIVKHQLLDIRIVIQRSLVFSIVFSFIIGVYLFLLFVMGFFFQQITDFAAVVITLITTVTGVYTVPLIEKYFMRVTDRIFFKDKYDYSEAVFSLSEVLNKNINLEILLKKIADKLKQIFKTKELIIILPEKRIILDRDGIIRTKITKSVEELIRMVDSDKSLLIDNEIFYTNKNEKTAKSRHDDLIIKLDNRNKFHIAIIASIRLDNKLKGIAVLGQKLSGDPYTTEDRNLIKTFSFQAAVALEKSQLYEKVKYHSVELEKKVEERTIEIKNLQEGQKYNVPMYWTTALGGYGIMKPYEKPITKTESVNRFSRPQGRKDFQVVQRFSGTS